MRIWIRALCPDKISEFFNFRGIDKGTLQARQGVSLRKQHIAASNQLIGTTAIENSTRINLRGYPEGNTPRKVCFNHPGNHIDRRALGCDNHVDSYGT